MAKKAVVHSSTKARRREKLEQLRPDDDPIYAAIFAHQKAYHEFHTIIAEDNYLESLESSPEVKKSYRNCRRRYSAASDAEMRAAWALTLTVPTSWDGLDELLYYTSNYVFKLRMDPSDLARGVPTSVMRAHPELEDRDLADSAWWIALILNVTKALMTLRETRADTCLPKHVETFRQIEAERAACAKSAEGPWPMEIVQKLYAVAEQHDPSFAADAQTIKSVA